MPLALGEVFDTSTDLEAVPAGYQDMADRECVKVLITPWPQGSASMADRRRPRKGGRGRI